MIPLRPPPPAVPGRATRPLLSLLACLALLPAAGCLRPRAAAALLGQDRHLVDLTHTLSPDFPYLPVKGATFAFRLAPIATLEQNGVAANKWELTEHNGTHLDAPSHFAAQGRTLDQLEPAQLIAPAVVIDLRQRAEADPDTELTVADLRAFEAAQGPIPAGAAVFLYSGWEERVGSQERFLNADAAGVAHFPGFSTEAVDFLLRARKVRGLGTDTLSLDPGRELRYPGHRSTAAAGAWVLECVANLGRLPPQGAVVLVGATKVRGASGGPARVLALW